MSLKVKTKVGKVIAYPTKKVKQVIKGAGFTGKLLISTAGGVLKEAGKFAKEGIITTTDLEKAIVESVSNTNKVLVNSIPKLTKKILK
ncbi:hypothetical protein HYT23_03940 [Candidatus Pacearchaeota archaeon]|nr:hypothetical protein [Candidatus Pacearchaeota archaeon]